MGYCVAFSLLDQLVHERIRDGGGQIVYDERQLAPVAVRYKERISRFTLEDAMV